MPQYTHTKNAQNLSDDQTVRLEKYLSHEGICSRREAKDLVERRLVIVNGKQATSGGLKIDPENDVITFHPDANILLDGKETVLVYKPRGCVSSKDEDEGVKTIFDVFPEYAHLNNVGRLDKESEGLILLSNDGLITKAVTGKNHILEKEYIVTVREGILEWMIEKFRKGIKLNDGWTKPADATRVDNHTFKITLTEGRKHQIRRMANKCNLTITSLKRIRIAHLKIGKMRPGGVKVLSENDINKIKELS